MPLPHGFQPACMLPVTIAVSLLAQMAACECHSWLTWLEVFSDEVHLDPMGAWYIVMGGKGFLGCVLEEVL